MKKNSFIFLVPVCLGGLIFLLIVGPRALDPTNIAWLSGGDPSTGYLGWVFFRQDEWRFPLALNPHYGLELSSSILYSDSNVLFAFIFKAFSFILPPTFQYFGIWILLCFILQAYASWKILQLISNNFYICFIGTIIFVFSPNFLARLYGHYNLLGHFFILMSLYIIIKQDISARKWQWLILLICASLVHSYLSAMVIALWFTDLVTCLLVKKISSVYFIKECIIFFMVIFVTLYLGGYFTITKGLEAGGYGLYRMNILSLFNPSGWSYILKALPECPGNYEGFNYLGLGNLFLLFWTIPVYITNRKKIVFAKKYYPLAILFMGFTLFAITSDVSFLNYNFHLFTINFSIFKMFRASGRFFWPVFYIIILLCIWTTIKFRKRDVAIFLLTLSAFFQIIDTHIIWSDFRKIFMVSRASVWDTPLKNSFWNQAADRYSKLRAIPPNFTVFKDWSYFAQYAGKNGLKIDLAYLARMDPSALNRLNQHNADMSASGLFEKDTLYLIHEDYVSSVKQNIDTNKNFFTNVDGFYILAPHWKNF